MEMKGALNMKRPFAKVQVSALFHYMRDINSGKGFSQIYQSFVRRHARPDETFINIGKKKRDCPQCRVGVLKDWLSKLLPKEKKEIGSNCLVRG